MSRWYSTHTFDERVKLINEICQFIENGAVSILQFFILL